MENLYANIALDTPLDQTFTYSIPDYLIKDVKVGSRVLVPFGNRTLTGFVLSLSDETNVEKLKQIHSVLDIEPILNQEMIEFSKWISDYYLSPVGEIISQFIPKNISINSEISFELSEDYYKQLSALKKPNEIVFDVIKVISESKDKRVSRKQLENKIGSNLSYHLDYLVKHNVLVKKQSYTSATKEVFTKYVKRNFKGECLEEIISEHKIKIDKQKELLKILSENDRVEQIDLTKKHKFSTSTINSLLKKELIEVFEVKRYRRPETIFEEEKKDLTLNKEQQVCFNEILKPLSENKFQPFLIHGITGSGKTEVYIRVLEEVIKANKTGIVLVPEISLTPQLISRFKNKFNDIVGVIHSKLSEGERLDNFMGIREGKIKIIIGPRSALFAALKNIGIIIVDEEHEVSYKQENSPRYNARDAAIIRAKINNAVVVLGSATPSVESFYNARNDKYKLLKLTTRATDAELPYIKIVDLKNPEKSDGFYNNEIIEKAKIRFLSKELLYAIQKRIVKKESVILLQNRRGYHSYIECVTCGYVEVCVRCNISLTYHKHIDYLKCHICGFTEKMITKCKECGCTKLIESGAGTEKIEEELNTIFPKAVIERMDSDTMVSKFKYQKVLNEFSKGNIDILVGTQIISKGLDFPNVTLVGVVNADIGMLLPDFRAEERTFQLLTQVSGRSGRSNKRGEVLIQTRHYEYGLFENVRDHNYETFYRETIKSREEANYPPFSRVALIELKSKDYEECKHSADEIYKILKEFKYASYLSIGAVTQPLISKVKDQYRFHIVVKSSKQTDPSGKLLVDSFRNVKNTLKPTGNIRISYDIDSYNFM